LFSSSIVTFLAEKFKASIYERTRDGSTLMHIAAVNGHPETAMALFEKGVSGGIRRPIKVVFAKNC
jgi:hypothetical protein